jgi:hypothetical protein
MRVSKWVGIAAMGLLVAEFITVLPGIKRYVRISTM